jgi:hypothetical protein
MVGCLSGENKCQKNSRVHYQGTSSVLMKCMIMQIAGSGNTIQNN